ncbi:MAG: hypothetical protein C4575_08405 [Desulforudis sp.]|jgi:hypothetical protein|nr:hypothetical protein [Clostridia bacterium]MDQ7792159.1 hypothetical protein [Clostridia bacterium]RJX19577.1 MAG: hypothetical protein C4575_08405 [Desulforudis sp.]
MKRIALLSAVALLLGVGLIFSVYASADRSEPGTSADPLVTRSFVEEYVQRQLGQAPSGGGTWQIVTLSPGQVFLGGDGTEFIVRGGQVVVVDPTGSGIPSLTSGTNLTNGRTIPANHLGLVPRKDGRGLKANTNVIIMYRGSAEVR